MGGNQPNWFEQLVTQVHGRAGTAEAAVRLAVAVEVGTEHAAVADRLLDHFVAEARDAGMSWTDIGSRLGISKQAARQRFAERTATPVLPFAARPAPRLQSCLDRAADEARLEGADEIGTQHVLTGLLAEGVAAAILEHVGVSADAIRASSHRLFGSPSPSLRRAADAPPMSAEAVCALDSAACQAAAHDPGSAHSEIRTEHLLAVLALDSGSRARRVLNDLGVDIAAIKRELQCYITVKPPRPARWWKRRPPVQHGCSFCGRHTPAAGPLVHGPGVAICAACVVLSRDILNGPAT